MNAQAPILLHTKEHPNHLGRYFGLLVSLAIILISLPFAERVNGIMLIVLSVSIVVAIAFAIAAAGHSRTKLIISSVLALPNLILMSAFFFGWFGLKPTPGSALPIAPFFAAFWFYITHTISRAFVREKQFTRDKICGAISVFILIGITWASFYLSVQLALDNSFVVMHPGGDPTYRITPSQSVYFSFLTMSTMGYGDIVPNNNIVRTVAYSQAIVGVLFIAVFIARVVSLYEQHYRRHQKKDE